MRPTGGSCMGSRTLHPETTAEAYLELLKDRGIDVFLGNAGTDFASLVEAFARFESAGGRAPVKWGYELRTPVQVESVVDRAFELMLAEPRGPIYLTLPREVLAARPGPMTITSPSRRESRSERFPDPARIDEAARILARAEHPIILTSAAGIDARAVAGL